MKITTNQLLFIDTYLENSGVEFLDIRFEMVDHVASALETQEGDFYEQFKSYMIENKTALLKSNKSYQWAAEKKVWRSYGKLLVSPKHLIIYVALLFGFYTLFANFKAEDVVYQYKVLGVALIFLLMVYSEWRMYRYKVKLVSLRKSTFLLLFIYYFQILFLNPFTREETHITVSRIMPYSLVFALVLYAAVIYIIHFYRTISFYKTKIKLIS